MKAIKNLIIILVIFGLAALIGVDKSILILAAGVIYGLGEVVYAILTRKRRAYENAVELSDEFKRNPRFVRQNYKTFKHAKKMDKALLAATKKECMKDAKDNAFDLETQINKAYAAGNKVKLSTKFHMSKLYILIDYRRLLNAKKVEYGMKEAK